MTIEKKWPIGTFVRLLKLKELDEPKHKTATWNEYYKSLPEGDPDNLSLPIYWEATGVIVFRDLQEGKSLSLFCQTRNNKEINCDLQTSTVQVIRDKHENMVEFDTHNSTYALIRLEKDNVIVTPAP